MAFKIEISQFYNYSEPKQWKQNQTVFHGRYSNLASLFIGSKILTFIIAIFQFYCKNNHYFSLFTKWCTI